MKTKPLITFYVIACNQEHLVGEAVAGALAQTYSPLEVLLSDDCSDDSTFEVMCKLAKKYQGPHIVTLRRNELRLGVGAHINRIIKAAKGEWIVASAGDDVSLPERTEALYSLWVEHGCTPDLLYSNLLEVREDGSAWYARDFRKEVPGGCVEKVLTWTYRERLTGKVPRVHGAAFAYPKSTFEDFGPLHPDIVFEDAVLNRRAELRGGVLLCPDFLVRHRNHSKQLTNVYSTEALLSADSRRRELKWSDVVILRQNLSELESAIRRGFISESDAAPIRAELKRQAQQHQQDFDFFWSKITTRWAILIRNLPDLLHRKRLSEILFGMLPRRLYLLGLRMLVAARTHRSTPWRL